MVKRSIFVAAIFSFVFSSSAYSQVFRGFGVKVGLNFSDQDWNRINYFGRQDPDWNLRTGLTVGMFAELFSNSHWSAFFELSYEQKGLSGHNVFPLLRDDRVLTHRIRVDYLCIALAPKLRLDAGQSALNPYVFAGPVYSIFLREEGSQLFEHKKGAIKITPSLLHSKSPWGLVLGLGLELSKLAPDTLLIEAQFMRDLSSSDRIILIYNKTFEISVGIRI